MLGGSRRSMLGNGRFRRAIGPDDWLGLGVGQELSRQG
jgi:hypothetical protein